MPRQQENRVYLSFFLFWQNLYHRVQHTHLFSIFPYFYKNKYKQKYTKDMKGHYEDSGIDKKTMHAMKVRKLASDVSKHSSSIWFHIACY